MNVPRTYKKVVTERLPEMSNAEQTDMLGHSGHTCFSGILHTPNGISHGCPTKIPICSGYNVPDRYRNKAENVHRLGNEPNKNIIPSLFTKAPVFRVS